MKTPSHKNPAQIAEFPAAVPSLKRKIFKGPPTQKQGEVLFYFTAQVDGSINRRLGNRLAGTVVVVGYCRRR